MFELPLTVAQAVPWLLERQGDVAALQAASPWLFGFGFFVAFTLLSAFTLPGCCVLSLAAGLCFGSWSGTVLVSAASTAGAALSFLTARHALRDRVQRRFPRQLDALGEAMAREGALVLLSLRLAPVIPFAIVNPLMGLTRMPLAQFAGLSFVGMLPGSALYVLAGTGLAQWVGGGPLLSPLAWAGLAALALLPWLLRPLLPRRVALAS